MDITKTREKLTSIFGELGMTEELQDLFLYVLEPLIEDYMMNLFSVTFTEEETEEIVDRVAQDERLDTKDIAGILFMEYEEKTGKSVEDELDKYIDLIADDIKRILEHYKAEVDKLRNLSPEERARKMLEDISKPLDIKLDIE